MKFYEVELWRDYKDENGKVDGGITDYSLCIKGLREPSVIEAEHFLAKDIKALGYKGVTRVFEISEEEAYNFFDMGNSDNFPIFGMTNSKEKRIIDKAVTLVKDLIKLLGEELVTTNSKLSQIFDDNVSDLLSLEDILYEVENNLYNPPQKTEFALIGYNKDKDLYDELYVSTDVKECMKMGETVIPLCEKDSLRDTNGEPYDYLEVVNADNYDVVYWRSYKEIE